MEEWKEYKLGDIATFKYGTMPKKDKISDNGLYPIFSGYRIVGYYDEYNLEKSELIIVARGVGGTGDAKLSPEKCFLTNLSIVVFLNENIISKKYAYYYFTLNNLRYLDSGSAQSQITISDLSKVSIKLPPLPTQQKIAAILSSLDDKIELNNKINTNLEQQAGALFKNWFVDFEPFGGKMPEGWKEKPLYDYAEFINGTSFKEDEYDTKGVPIIKIAELKNGITDTTQYFNGEKDPKYDVKNGDILFSWSGNPETSIDIFIWSLGDGILNQHTFNVKSNTGRKWFTYCLLKYFKPEFCHRASCKQTTGLGHVTANDLKQITFNSGEKEESNFEALITPIMNQIFNNKIENQKLVSIRDTLLPKLMNGEIEV